MKKNLILIFGILFFIIFANFISAVVVYSEFEDQSKSKTIEFNDSINFSIYSFSMNPPMIISVEMRDSSYNLIHVFLKTTTSSITKEYSETFKLNSSIYPSLGTYYLITQGTDKNSQQSSQLTLTIQDTTKPVITLLGDSIVNITLGNSYVDAGATAYDNVDGDITSKIVVTGSVNTNVLGTYTLKYNVKDNAGNSADEKTRIVNVVPVPIPPTDTTKPTINIISPLNNSIYNDYVKFFNFIAKDENLDKCQYSLNNDTKIDISCFSNVLKTVSINSSEGKNELTVYAIDKSGNMAYEKIIFFVNLSILDITPPNINVLTPEQNKKYTSEELTFKLTTDEEAEVYFSLDDNEKIKMNNPYDHVFTYTLSLSDKSHKVIFYAIDKSGNSANKTINFIVDYQLTNNNDKKVKSKELNEAISNEINTNIESYSSSYQIKNDTIFLIPEKKITKKNWFVSFLDKIIAFFKKLFNIK
jgi:hypothetical protein